MNKLPRESSIRKQIPMYSGLLKYFPGALAVVAFRSWFGNQQHHPDKPLHWDRAKSQDHLDCIIRHAVDGEWDALAWRALANLQIQLENGYRPEGWEDGGDVPTIKEIADHILQLADQVKVERDLEATCEQETEDKVARIAALTDEDIFHRQERLGDDDLLEACLSRVETIGGYTHDDGVLIVTVAYTSPWSGLSDIVEVATPVDSGYWCPRARAERTVALDMADFAHYDSGRSSTLRRMVRELCEREGLYGLVVDADPFGDTNILFSRLDGNWVLTLDEEATLKQLFPGAKNQQVSIPTAELVARFNP